MECISRAVERSEAVEYGSGAVFQLLNGDEVDQGLRYCTLHHMAVCKNEIHTVIHHMYNTWNFVYSLCDK